MFTALIIVLALILVAIWIYALLPISRKYLDEVAMDEQIKIIKRSLNRHNN